MNDIISYLDSEIINYYRKYLLHIKDHIDIFRQEASNIPLEEFFQPKIISYDNNVWNLYIVKRGNQKIDEKKYTPQTFEILNDKIYVNVTFSLLSGGSEINRHNDSLKFIYRSHLGLDVPENYQFICNDFDMTTQNGEISLFDLTHYHYGYNKSQKNRLVLMVDLLKIEYIDFLNIYDKNLLRHF